MNTIAIFDGKYMFLSNFYNASCTFEGKIYPTVEHAFQAAKTLIPEEREEIRKADTPGKAKRMGRAVTLRPDWEEVKTDVMRQCLRSKFSFGPIAIDLINTGDAELIEGNYWHDNIWGSCTCEKCGNKGENRLGKLLMEIREELRNA